jgi:hypothetical protein
VANFIFASTSSALDFFFAASGVHPVSWIDKVEFETSARVSEALDPLDRCVGETHRSSIRAAFVRGCAACVRGSTTPELAGNPKPQISRAGSLLGCPGATVSWRMPAQEKSFARPPAVK